MTRAPSTTGSKFLERQSSLSKARAGRERLTDILVVEDDERDSLSIAAKLRKVCGHEVGIRHARTLSAMLDRALEKRPEIVFLDHILKPNDTAFKSVEFMRGGGYDGPIVVVSSQMTDRLAAQLRRIGVLEALHKDDLNGGRIAEVLQLMQTVGEPAAKPAEPARPAAAKTAPRRTSRR